MGNGAKPAGTVVSAAVFDARAEAQRILAEARAEADALRAQARDEGLAAARETARAETTQTLVRLHAETARARAAAADDVKRLAIRIAEKIVGRALTLDPDVIADICAQAVRGAAEQRQIVLRVHPDDLPALERARPRLRSEFLRAHDVTLRADPAVGRGGCIVDTEVGSIDARLETQLGALERALTGDDE